MPSSSYAGDEFPQRAIPASIGTQTQPSLAGVRVLVAEDEILVALDLKMMLHSIGCVVLGSVADSSQTLALLRQEGPDIVLLDLGLADGFALPVAEALLAAGIPCVLTAGYPCDRLEQPALCAMPRLDRPYGIEKLKQTLLQVLRR